MQQRWYQQLGGWVALLAGCSSGSLPEMGTIGSLVETSIASTTAGNVQQMALSGCCFSDYTVAMQIGDQSFTLLLDTGSQALAVAATECSSGCSDLSPLYQPSTTAEALAQNVTQWYGVSALNGWSGTVYQDSITFNDASFLLKLVAITSASENSSTTQAFFTSSQCTGESIANDYQGILGLAPNAVGTTTAYDNFITEIGLRSDNASEFSLQLCDLNGHVWWNGVDANSMVGNLDYTALNTDQGYYQVTLQGMSLGGNVVNITSSDALSPAVLDTGTSGIYVPSDVYQTLVSALQSDANYQTIFCGGTTCSTSNSPLLTATTGVCMAAAPNYDHNRIDANLPPLTLILMGNNQLFTVVLPATSAYLAAIAQQDATAYCGALFDIGWPSTSTGQKEMVILGNLAMHSHIWHFDYANARVGLAQPSIPCTKLP